MKKSPLALMTERFTDKAGLVKAVRELATTELFTERVNDEKGLDHVSNKKLLHLHDVLSRVKSEFGSRAALVDECLKVEKREKDQGFRARLEKFSTPRLYDHLRGARRRASARA